MNTVEDAWSREQWLSEARWYVRLSDGSTVFMDDGRPGLWPHSAWLRLAQRVRDGLTIQSFWLAFRDHVERPVPDGAEGYFFVRVGVAFPGDAATHQLFRVGHMVGDVVRTSLWKVPELVHEGDEDRPAGKAGDALIRSR